MTVLPRKEDLTICFAHVAYRMADRFAARNTGIRHFQVTLAGRADRAHRRRRRVAASRGCGATN